MATAQAQALQTTYIYKGKTRKGKPIQGETKGTSIAMVRAQLLQQGIAATQVRKKPKPLFGGSKPIKPADIATFTRQMATMMKAGVPLVQSFEIVADGADKQSLKDVIFDVRDTVASGTSFATALKRHPKYFDELFCNLVEAGEHAGSLESMLDRIATYKEKTEALKTKIRKALTYPAVVILVAIVVTGILLVKVVPVFATTFEGFGADLPAFTQLVLRISEVAQKYWLAVIAVVIAIGFGFQQGRKRSERFAYLVDKYALKLPIVGNILYEAIVARFARTLSTTFAAGVPLVESLSSVAGAAGNAIYRDAILKVRDDVTAGVQLNTAMRGTQRFPVLVLQMTAIGEESGSLDEMLAKTADHYEASVDNAVDNLTTLLEPMIMAVLGILVGCLMVAMYLPIFQLGNVI